MTNTKKEKSIFKQYVRKSNAGVDAAIITTDLLALLSTAGTPKRLNSDETAQIGDYLVKDEGGNVIIPAAEFEDKFRLRFPGSTGKSKDAVQEVEVAAAESV